jgi:hypothetical protein
VSSWIRSTNFDQETAQVTQLDPLGIVAKSQRGAAPEQSYGHIHTGSVGEWQKDVEDTLAHWVSDHTWAVGHRYHLFDFSLFLSTLAATRDLDNALYQLNIQSWFSITASDTDGRGWVGIRASYRDSWASGLDIMAERYLKRMRLSNLLTDRYWQLLEDDIRDFQHHGTHVYLVRLPEHPEIREFNNVHYQLPERLSELGRRTATPVLDLSGMGPADGVHLFDSVHPDEAAARVITHRLAIWLRERGDLP